ncbi:MAG TPA: hypothetical protein VII39_02490 [Bradyrhizobium sp.]|jgi:hypothetical protein
MQIRFAALAATLFASTAAHAGDCSALMAATRAGATKPYSSTIVMTHPGKPPETSHAVMTGDKMYVQVEGVWHAVRMGTKELLQTIDDNAKTAKMTCVHKGEGEVNGQPATIWSAHVVNQGMTSENTVWIGRSGLPLKTESDLGDGLTVVSVLDYAHYAVPAGVK